MKKTSRIISLILALSMALTGCSMFSDEDSDGREIKVRLNETVDADSKWINSSIEGAIDADTPTELKDDFYTAVNKEWILLQKLDDDHESIDFTSSNEDALKFRLKSIIFDTPDPDALEQNQIGYSETEKKHNEELIHRFTQAAADWDSRNSLGAEPLRPYIERIESISSMSELTEYVTAPYTDNYSGAAFASIVVDSTTNDPANDHVKIDVHTDYTLGSADFYISSNSESRLMQDLNRSIVYNLLGRLGYTDAETERLLSACYRLEGRLADHSRGASQKDYTDNERYYTLAEIEELQGNYPLTTLIVNSGLESAGKYAVYRPDYIRYLSELYNERHLDEIKAYYVVHTALAMAPLLDRENYDIYAEAKADADASSGDNTDKRDASTGDKELDIILNDFAMAYLQEPLDMVYVSRYCTPAYKELLTDQVEKTKKAFACIIDGDDWLSEEAREKAKEKLEAMKVSVMYPSHFTDYTALNFEDGDGLPEMAARINAFRLARKAEKAEKPHSVEFSQMSTCTINAYYMPTENSINILCGILADGSMFNADDPVEVRYAKLGTVIGHEISHAFDAGGIRWDKDGHDNRWMPVKDIVAFTGKVSSLNLYYSGITAIPGKGKINGSVVSREATADMGGLKCMLRLAEDIPDFDYDLFFRSYAELWRCRDTYDLELASAESDSHPVANLRVNATLQQFEKFYETYGITEGDGMYLAPEKRIAVW